eukprot:gene13859-13981_t
MADEADIKENRFSYLLQPIRDLAANWDINIAGELEEYLEELEHISFTIEGCGPALNFAEAALLIQGTTCVFSKKVEYLHNLVYQALETIINKKQKEKQSATGKDKGARRGVHADELDDPRSFFNLSQHLETAAAEDIDLDEDDETAPPALIRPPTALLALEEAACGQGGQQGAHSEASNCRLAQCSVHVSGALLLESRDGELYDAQLRTAAQHRVTERQTADLAALGRVGVGSQCGTAAAPADAVAGTAAVVEDMDPDDLNADTGHEGYCDDDDGGAVTNPEISTCPECPLDPGMQDASTVTAPLVEQAVDGDSTMEGAGQEQQLDAEQPPWLAEPHLPATAELLDAHAAVEGATGDSCDAGADAAARQAQQHRTRQGKAAGPSAAEYYDPYLPLDPADPAGTLPIKPLQVNVFGDNGYEDDYEGDANAMLESLEDAAAGAGGAQSWAKEAPDWVTAGAANGNGDAELSYEELCRWRARIDPILAAEEDRTAFDIHDYGTKIISKLAELDVSKDKSPATLAASKQQHTNNSKAQRAADDSNDRAGFADVAAASNSFEVCRLFAAMLQLVNNRNVALIRECDQETGTCSSLQLQLLSVARVHEAMADGLAAGKNAQTEGENPHVTVQLEAPPPRSKAGSSKPRGTKEAAGGSKSSKSKPGAKASGRPARQKNAMEPDSSSSSGGEDSCGQDSSSCSDSEHGKLTPQQPAKNGKQGRRRNAAAEVEIGDDYENQENQGSKDLAAAKAVAGKSGAAKPPAKRVRKMGTVIG